jgi:hypothetical protein
MLGCTAAVPSLLLLLPLLLLLLPLLLLPAGPGRGVKRATSFARASSTCGNRSGQKHQLK